MRTRQDPESLLSRVNLSLQRGTGYCKGGIVIVDINWLLQELVSARVNWLLLGRNSHCKRELVIAKEYITTVDIK